MLIPDLNPIVILTNVDSVCQLTEDDTINVFQSKVVKNKVDTHCESKDLI